MTAFASANDVLFRDVNLAEDATWTPVATGVPTSVRVVRSAGDTGHRFDAVSLVTPVLTVDVRVAEADAPVAGDTMTVGGTDYLIQGAPIRDDLDQIWTIELVSAG